MASSSASPQAAGVEVTAAPPSIHKRTYQACIPCRRRKVRCDLGSVDEPHDPPCVRCRREKKDCFFTETRRKRKAEDEGDGDDMRIGRSSENFPARNPGAQGEHGSHDATHDNIYPAPTLAPAGKAYGGQDGLGLPGGRKEKTPGGREVTNETAAALFQSPINNPGDALYLLVDAVARTGDLEKNNSVSNQSSSQEHRRRRSSVQQNSRTANIAQIHSPAIDPALVGDPDITEALQAWSRLRFVKAGWCTAREAISLIDYFYKHLAPMTPICPPDFSSPSSHTRLLSDEPMLAVTLLTIAARYKKMSGPGAQSRSFIVHEKLWLYLQGMITRMFWGQEQFGGGFCGAGTVKRSSNGKGLRSLGTIESLLLLSDWHPRSMHFAPGDDGDEILAPSSQEMDGYDAPNSPSANTYAVWTEPARRSDRMSWSLVGYAYTLSYELGLFDCMTESGVWIPKEAIRTSDDGVRANRIGRLLHIYVSQACGRLGFPNMLPRQDDTDEIDFFKMEVPSDRIAGSYDPNETSENIQRAWAELAALNRKCNTEMFPTKAVTRDMIASGEYLKYLEDYRPRLQQWLERFNSIEVPPLSRSLLLMEYEYNRTYINSLSLQAVLEQCAITSEENNGVTSHGGHTPPALLPSKMVNLYKENAVYIAEVVDASRNVLRHVIEGLVPHDGLKHAPVRTYFRVLSGAMFLLKTFALGAKEKEVSTSISLLDATVFALRSNVVDDVHLSLRIADLLHGLTRSIRTKFVRLAIPTRPSSKRSTHPPKPLHQHQHSDPYPRLLSPKNNAKRPSTSSHAQHPSTHSFLHNADSSPPLSFTGLRSTISGIATNLVDPNDASITIMPPPDYIYNPFPTHSNPSGSPPNPYNSTTTISPHQSFPNHHFSQSPPPSHHQQQFPWSPPPTTSLPSSGSPSIHNSTTVAAATAGGSSGSAGGSAYDWLALDVNKLLNPGSGNNGGGGGAEFGWAGAFGPDIGESLEMLEVLGGEGYGFGGADGGGW